MTANEIKLLDEFLEELEDRFSSDGCNDYELPDTEENRRLAGAAYQNWKSSDPDYIGYSASGGKLHCNNILILAELRRRLTAMKPTPKKKPAKTTQEFTSAEVASIAGRILAVLKNTPVLDAVWVVKRPPGLGRAVYLCKVDEFQAVLASALTQARDRKAAR